VKNIIKTIKLIFSNKKYLTLTIIVAISLVLINVMIINKGVISFLLKNDFLKTFDRLIIIKSAFLDTWLLFSYLEIIFIVVIALLAGLSVSFLLFFIKNKIKKGIEGGASVFGIVLSFFGVGCVSCGSVILTSFLGLSASAAFIGFLPLNGVEFLIFSVVFLGWSIYSIAKKIQNPQLCRIKIKG